VQLYHNQFSETKAIPAPSTLAILAVVAFTFLWFLGRSSYITVIIASKIFFSFSFFFYN
jgi:hypothetical protein